MPAPRPSEVQFPAPPLDPNKNYLSAPECQSCKFVMTEMKRSKVPGLHSREYVCTNPECDRLGQPLWITLTTKPIERIE